MLERFHVDKKIAILVSKKKMESTVEQIFLKIGFNKNDAKQATDVLVYSDIRGIESHGVSNMLRAYVKSANEGGINTNPKWKITKDFNAVCSIDSDQGLGLVVGPHGMKEAIKRAKKFGIGAVNVYNSGHFGPAAYYAHLAVKENLVGLATTTGGIGVIPTFGTKQMIGLNPLGFGAPTVKNPPFIFDASTSSVAGNKIALAKRLNVKAMGGWISDSNGVPIMEETEIPDEYNILPLGGTREIGSHKGYGLAVMLEIMTSILSATGGGLRRRNGSTHHFIAYNIDAFSNLKDFTKDLDDYLDDLKQNPPVSGQERVVYAGLLEHETEIEREQNGIPYHPEVIDWFKSITSELKIDW